MNLASSGSVLPSFSQPSFLTPSFLLSLIWCTITGLWIQLKINPTQKMVVCILVPVRIWLYLSRIQWKRSAFLEGFFGCFWLFFGFNYYYYYFLALTLALFFSEAAIMESVLFTWSKEKGERFPRCCTGSQCAFWASIEGIWSMWV